MNATVRTHYMGKVKVYLSTGTNYSRHINDEDGQEMIYSDGAYVQAHTEDGQRWVHTERFTDEDEANDFAAYIRYHGGIINLEARDKNGILVWVEGSYIYGSKLYQLSGDEQAWAERERLEESWY